MATNTLARFIAKGAASIARFMKKNEEVTSYIINMVIPYNLMFKLIFSLVPEGSIIMTYSRIRNRKPVPTKVTVQEHQADRAGLHYDFRVRSKPRVISKNTLISFATKNKPDNHSTKPYTTLFIRQPDHAIEYENFSGRIIRGYGKGKVKIDYQSPGIMWTDGKNIKILTPYSTNPWSGYWTLIPQEENKFLAVRKPAFQTFWIARKDYGSATTEKLTPEKYGNIMYAERKVDGANYIAVIGSPGLIEPPDNTKIKTTTIQNEYHNFKIATEWDTKPTLIKDRIRALQAAQRLYEPQKLLKIHKNRVPVTISFISRRYGVDGPLMKSDRVPQLAFGYIQYEKLKLLGGVATRCELWHPKGVNTLSAILNSNPEKALELQKEHGPIRCMFFDIEGWPTDTFTIIPINIPYINKYLLLESLAKEMSYPNKTKIITVNKTKTLFSIPDYVTGPPEKIIEFFNNTKKLELPLGEGIVIKDLYNPSTPPIKLKHRETITMTITGFTEGNGKYKGTLGALSASNNSLSASIGSGLSDQQRNIIWNNKDKFINTQIEVIAMDTTSKSLRAPVIHRFINPPVDIEPM